MKKVSILKGVTLALALFLATGVAFAKGEHYGQEVQLKAGEYDVTFSTSPQSAEIGWNKVNIVIKDSSGKYVKDATVAVEYNMDPMAGAEMFAMPSKTKTALKGNIYQGDLKLSMEGVWHITVKIVRAGKEAELKHDLTVLPISAS